MIWFYSYRNPPKPQAQGDLFNKQHLGMASATPLDKAQFAGSVQLMNFPYFDFGNTEDKNSGRLLISLSMETTGICESNIWPDKTQNESTGTIIIKRS